MRNFISAMILTVILSALPFCASAGADVSRAPELAPITAADVSALPPVAEVRLPAAAVDELKPRDGLAPVIITVPGIRFDQLGWGPLETSNLSRFFKFLFHKEPVDEAALADAVAEYNQQFDFLNEGGEFHPAMEDKAPMPDTCIEDELSKLPEFSAGKATFVPFAWSRDPDESNTVVPGFVKKMAEVYDTYKGTGRPIYIVAHSWGTVLMHETMHRLGKERPDVRIAKFVTIGSPLVPGNPLIKIFKALQFTMEHLQKDIEKPAILGNWKNIWASRDPFSNKIEAADINIQVDADVPKYESRLKRLVLFNNALRGKAKNDFFKIINFKSWHSSYVYDFKASLESIEKDIQVLVLQPVLAPQLEDAK